MLDTEKNIVIDIWTNESGLVDGIGVADNLYAIAGKVTPSGLWNAASGGKATLANPVSINIGSNSSATKVYVYSSGVSNTEEVANEPIPNGSQALSSGDIFKVKTLSLTVSD